MKVLSQKLAVLLALCNASRASHLTALDIHVRFMQIRTDAAISDRKTDKDQTIQPSKNPYGHGLHRRGPVSSTCTTAIPGGNKGS